MEFSSDLIKMHSATWTNSWREYYKDTNATVVLANGTNISLNEQGILITREGITSIIPLEILLKAIDSIGKEKKE